MVRRQKNILRVERPGFGLVDTVVSLFVIGFLVLIFANLLTVRNVNRRILLRTQAAAIANEELSALKRMDISTLANQTNGAFKGTLYNAGAWQVAANGTAGHSAPNALELAGSSISGAVSGRLIFPAGAYGDGTLEAKWRLASDSPAAASFGYLFRSSDNANGYRLRVARTTTDLDGVTGGDQNVFLEKLVGGTATRIDSRAATISVDTWYTLKVVLSGSNISLYLDGNQLGSSPFSEATYASGSAALLGWSGAHAFVDDVQTITTGTQTWNFDANLNLPTAWVRLGLNDLPNATPNVFDDNGTLTIAAYPNTNSTSFKQATITINWSSGNGTDSFTTTALIGRSRIGQ